MRIYIQENIADRQSSTAVYTAGASSRILSLPFWQLPRLSTACKARIGYNRKPEVRSRTRCIGTAEAEHPSAATDAEQGLALTFDGRSPWVPTIRGASASNTSSTARSRAYNTVTVSLPSA